MKTMTLTGLGSEQNFSTGGTSYFLVFNDGELRVPISEDAAEAVVKEMYGQSNGQISNTDNSPVYESPPGHESDSDDEQEDDDGVGQI